jgi:hypothetical protein
MRHSDRGGRVRFAVDDPTDVSRSLTRIGIDRHEVDPGGDTEGCAMTVRYEAGAEAEKLFRYLVHRAQAADKIAWQQERAHDEIEGWCELCHAACQDECGAWCLFDFSSAANRDLLFCELSRRTDD